LLRQAVTACVLRKAYYGAETWWPGRTRPRGASTVSNLVDGHLNNLRKAVLAGARAILPVFRTTPEAALYREAGLLPPEIELNQLSLLASTRIRRLDPYHPLRRRAERILRTGRSTTRLARRVLALPPSEQVNPLQWPPWRIPESREAIMARISGPCGRTKVQAADDFQTFLLALSPHDIKLFSDGSQLADRSTGGGFIGYQATRLVCQGSFSLGSCKEVFDAEAEAALRGIQAAIVCPSSRFATNLWVFLDNVEVACRLLSPSTGSSQGVFNTFTALAASWPSRERLTHTSPGSVMIRWVPGHTKVPGNEAADLAAKEGAALPSPPSTELSYASLKRWAKDQAPRASRTLWLTVAPQAYKDLEVPLPLRYPAELKLARPLLGRLLAARSGHGDFASYHERFNHEHAHLLCSCGKRKSPLHFFFCRIARRLAPRPPGAPSIVIPSLLGTSKGARQLSAWLTQTRFFEDICPRYPLH
jgi:hypothetical protein